MSLYIFLLYYIYHLCFACIDFYDLSAWGGCLFVVCIKRFIYKFLNVCPFDYTTVAGSGMVGPVNRCVIELFCGVVCVVTLPFWHFRWCSIGAFVIGLSLISSFFSDSKFHFSGLYIFFISNPFFWELTVYSFNVLDLEAIVNSHRWLIPSAKLKENT